MVIDTACSSSLVALHYACKSLQTRESNLCFVGRVSLILSPPTISYSQSRLMAADGRCKTFDASESRLCPRGGVWHGDSQALV